MPVNQHAVKRRTPAELTKKAGHIALIRRIQAGDKKAVETLWTSNQGLIHLYVRKYARRVPVQDWDDVKHFIFSYFLRGAQKYDPDKNAGMPMAYLALWVRAGISNYIVKCCSAPGTEISTSSLAWRDDDSAQDALDRALRDQGSAEEPDAEDAAEGRRIEALIESLLEGLSVRECTIARLRLLADEPATLETVAVRCGCSRERIRQVEVILRRKIARGLVDHPEADVYGWRERFLANALLGERSRDIGRQAA